MSPITEKAHAILAYYTAAAQLKCVGLISTKQHLDKVKKLLAYSRVAHKDENQFVRRHHQWAAADVGGDLVKQSVQTGDDGLGRVAHEVADRSIITTLEQRASTDDVSQLIAYPVVGLSIQQIAHAERRRLLLLFQLIQQQLVSQNNLMLLLAPRLMPNRPSVDCCCNRRHQQQKQKRQQQQETK